MKLIEPSLRRRSETMLVSSRDLGEDIRRIFQRSLPKSRNDVNLAALACELRRTDEIRVEALVERRETILDQRVDNADLRQSLLRQKDCSESGRLHIEIDDQHSFPVSCEMGGDDRESRRTPDPALEAGEHEARRRGRRSRRSV